MNKVVVRAVRVEDRAGWDVLYQGYAAFYNVVQTAEMRDTVWAWLHDDSKESRGLVAVDADGRLTGITHFRPFARPLSATTGCYLDDLFVSPSARGTGCAEALIEGVKAVALSEGWSVVRWITAENNYRGRAVYDKLATRTNWVTYDIKV
ncbi:GNAT family N-acetyltransferase [Agrobacterium larrymoorei]|uniref:GNAT family N-acetyltransferase n=1 Tax=Agrobacterium larrymoorei TaxID=160699 RepID=UPI0015733C3E|nr:GNAT family N-acetyltransferase [Agrobacterium larrymoorei]NTJ41567.1 GNAT family N-acetyltransferase [Agrobacterium larrymoorei]